MAAVTPGGPADRAGVRRGDIVLEVDGVHVKPSCEGALDALLEGPSGSAVSMTLRHVHERQTNTVQLIRRAGLTEQTVPHDLDAPGPCFACLRNAAPRILGNRSIAFLWPAYVASLREQRAADPDTANTPENEAARRDAQIAFLRLVLDLGKFWETGAASARLHALPPALRRRLGVPPPPPPVDGAKVLQALLETEKSAAPRLLGGGAQEGGSDGAGGLEEGEGSVEEEGGGNGSTHTQQSRAHDIAQMLGFDWATVAPPAGTDGAGGPET